MHRLLSLLCVVLALIVAPFARAEHASTAPSVVVVAASASASAGPVKGPEAIVRLKDRKVFVLTVEREGRSAGERARAASQALESAFDARDGDARFESRVDEAGRPAAILFVGKTPILEIGQDDALAAGIATLDAYAADLTAKAQAAIKEERKRSAIANSVFSFSLVVFSGLIAFLLIGKASQLGARSRDFLEENPDRVPALRVGGIELMRPAAIEAFLLLAIDIAKRLAQLAIFYAWIIFSLSLFESTKGYTDKLTALVLGPIIAFFTRIGAGLPLAVVTVIAALALALLVRFTGVFFAGVARGETTIDWVPQDLAAPVGVVVRIGIVVTAILLAAPLLTGNDDNALSRAGLTVFISFALAATPVLATGIVGGLVVFGRRLRIGDFVELGRRTGRVRHVSLLEITIEDESGCEVRIPHFVSLWTATRVMGPSPVISVELVVDPKASQLRVREVLAAAASKVGSAVRVDLVSIDADGALHRVTVGVATQLVGPIVVPTTGRRVRSNPRISVPPEPRIVTASGIGGSTPGEKPMGVASSVQLTSLLADALAKEGIALGRRFAGARA